MITQQMVKFILIIKIILMQGENILHHVRNKVDHTYNQPVFEKQLNEEVHKNLAKMEQSIIKQLKRQLYLKEQEKKELQRQQKLKQNIEAKLKQSEEKRKKQKVEKTHTIKKQRQFRQYLNHEMKTELKRKQIQKTQSRIKELQQYEKKSPTISYHKIEHAVSLLQQPNYKNQLYATEEEYNKLKQMVQSKTKLPKKQLSLVELKPKGKVQEWDKQRQQKLSKHLNRIQDGRKKKQRQFQREKPTNFQGVESRIHNEFLEPGDKRSNKHNPQLSVLYEQGHDRQKHSYRKQIKEEIKQYLLRQKQSLLKSH